MFICCHNLTCYSYGQTSNTKEWNCAVIAWGLVITILARTGEAMSSNLCWNTGCLDLRTLWYRSVPPTIARIVLRSRCVSSINILYVSLFICYSTTQPYVVSLLIEPQNDAQNRKFWEEVINISLTTHPLIQRVPYTKHRAQELFHFFSCMCSHENVFAKPLPINCRLCRFNYFDLQALEKEN
jgi:hypothetical protein